jgi:hypothetical protein
VEKKKSRVVYTVTFDQQSRMPVHVIESVVAVAKEDPSTGAAQEYYIFTTEYRMDRFGEVERFEVPAEAARLLR